MYNNTNIFTGKLEIAATSVMQPPSFKSHYSMNQIVNFDRTCLMP